MLSDKTKIGMKRLYFLILPFIFCFPSLSFAFTWQDVMNSYNSCLASKGASGACWIEEVATNSGKGYRVYRRQDASTTVDYASTVVTGASYMPLNCWTYFLCDGKGTTKIVDVSELNLTKAYDLNTGTRQFYNNFCDGSKNVTGTNGPGWSYFCLFGSSSTCWITSYDVNNCKSSDTIFAAFIPTDQCLNKLTNTYEPCLQNCKDPVEKTSAAETCGDGIDNNCNGEIDEGCKKEIELPMTGYQCESKFKTTPPYYDKTQNTICNSGCSLAAMTMVLNYYLNTAGLPMVDIESLNEWLNENDGWDKNAGPSWGDLENYPAVKKSEVIYDDNRSLNIGKLNNKEITKEYLTQVLESELTSGHPVILRVSYTDSNGKTRQHSVVAVEITQTSDGNSTYTIIDPAHNTEKMPQKTTLERYDNKFYGIRIYTPKTK